MPSVYQKIFVFLKYKLYLTPLQDLVPQSKEKMLLFFWCLSVWRVECTGSVITSCKPPGAESVTAPCLGKRKVVMTRDKVLSGQLRSDWTVDWWGCTMPLPPTGPQVGLGPDGQAVGQDSGNDKGADMREKEKGDNYSHLGEKAISDFTIAIT